MQTQPALFDLGQCTATPGALKALEDNARDPRYFLWQHQHGDWGTVCAEDALANQHALLHKLRVFSVYVLPDGRKMWLITEADRSYSTIMLPSEY